MDPFDSEPEGDSIRCDAPDEDDRGNQCDSRQSLGLEYNYVPDWRPPHAIREYHQNWKDGIKETSRLKGRDFKILDKGFDSKGVYIIEARHPSTDQLLGFISWDNGTVQYSNFGAQLSRKALNLGVSTKRDDDNLAGTHGEGFKVASLVMLRRGYRVRYEASEYYWSFQFGGRNRDILYCKLTRMQAKKLKQQMQDFDAKAKTGSPRGLEANIWEDVTVKIGRILGKGDKVAREDFLKWIKVSLDLDRPSKVISTHHGRLILDNQFKGRIYLKGLLLENEPATPFKFCYDFYQGEVNRDRERLSNERQEAKTLSKIWGDAIQIDEAAALPEFVELLQANTQWADVNLAEEYISIDTAKKIWQQLQVENSENKLFYYFDQNGDKDIELITKSLQKQPAPLKKAMWLSLRRFKLIRTPQEHRRHLLQNALETDFHKTPYAEEVERALRSVLALDSRTRDLRLDFRSGTSAELDILLLGCNLVINDKWLDFHASHDKSLCSLFLEATAEQINIDRFSCSHIIKNLYDLVLVELSKGSSTQENRSSDAEHLRQMVREKIDQMPCMVEVIQGNSAGVLEVSWVHAESERISKLHHLELKGRVTMHRESTCAEKKSELLASGLPERKLPEREVDGSIDDSHQTGDCGCPEKVVSLKDSKAVFHGLDHEEKYFPMVARTDSQAFFARPANAVCPKAPDVDLPNKVPSMPTFAFTTRSVNRGVCVRNSENGSFENIYNDLGKGESIRYYGFPNQDSMSYSRSGITGLGEDISSRFESRASSPDTLIQEDVVGQPIKGEIALQRRRYAQYRQMQKLKTEMAILRRSLCVKDQQLQSFEAEVMTLRSQLDGQIQHCMQLEYELETQRDLLVDDQPNSPAASSGHLEAGTLNLESSSNNLTQVDTEPRQQVERKRQRAASGASIHQGQLASETDTLSTVPRDTLDKWHRIADGETLTQLWLCLYAQRQPAWTAEPDGALETPDPSDTSIEGQLRKYQLQYLRGTRGASKHKQLAKIPLRLYLANIAGLYQREQLAREAVNKKRRRYRGRKLDTAKISRKSVFDIFVDFLLPELRQHDTDTYETAKIRFENWMQYGKRWAILVIRFSAGILLLIPQDLSDNNLRNTPLAEVYALVEHLDSYRPSLQADIQNLTAHLSPLIEDRCLPDQRLKLEVLTESQITSGVLATLSLKELFELSDGYSHLLTEAASSDLSESNTESFGTFREETGSKEGELSEVKTEPIAQTRVLDANDAALSVSEQRLEQVMHDESKL